MLPTGKTNNHAVTQGLGRTASMGDEISFVTVFFLRAAKGKIKIIYYFGNSVKKSNEQWHLKVWFGGFLFCFFGLFCFLSLSLK